MYLFTSNHCNVLWGHIYQIDPDQIDPDCSQISRMSESRSWSLLCSTQKACLVLVTEKLQVKATASPTALKGSFTTQMHTPLSCSKTVQGLFLRLGGQILHHSDGTASQVSGCTSCVMSDFGVVLPGLRQPVQLRITDKLGSLQKVKQLGNPKDKILCER